MHDYVSIEPETEDIEIETKDSHAVMVPCKSTEIVPEEPQASQSTVMKEDIDSDWQQPISLIALRKKLNKVFTNK